MKSSNFRGKKVGRSRGSCAFGRSQPSEARLRVEGRGGIGAVRTRARTRTDCAGIQVSVLRHAGTVKGQRGISRSLRFSVNLSVEQRAALCSLIGLFPWPNYRRIVAARYGTVHGIPPRLPAALSPSKRLTILRARVHPPQPSPRNETELSIRILDLFRRACNESSCRFHTGKRLAEVSRRRRAIFNGGNGAKKRGETRRSSGTHRNSSK